MDICHKFPSEPQYCMNRTGTRTYRVPHDRMAVQGAHQHCHKNVIVSRNTARLAKCIALASLQALSILTQKSGRFKSSAVKSYNVRNVLQMLALDIRPVLWPTLRL